MAFRLHFVEDVFDIPIRPNNERRPRHAHHFLAVHVLFLDHAVSIGNFLVSVAQQRKWQVELVFKFLQRFGFIRRNPQNHGAALFSLLVGIAELAGFNGASWRVGPRVEIKHDPLSAKILQRDWLGILIGQSKLRGFIIDIDIHDHLSFSIKFSINVIPHRAVARHLQHLRFAHFPSNCAHTNLARAEQSSQDQQRPARPGVARTAAEGQSPLDSDHYPY